MAILKHINPYNQDDVIGTALDIQKKCAQVGFDWQSVEPVFDKVEEELEEIKEACEAPAKTFNDIEDEVGDLFFACINLARHLNVDPTKALLNANQKFVARFKLVEALHEKQLNNGKSEKTLAQMSQNELELLWQQAKNINMAKDHKK